MGLEEAGVKLSEPGEKVIVDECFQTSLPGVYAVGDLIDGPMLAHKASAEASAVVDVISGKKSEIRYDVLPGVIYTWPEVAGIGLTEEQVKEQGRSYQVAVIPFAGSGRAQAAGETDGQVKVICDGFNQKILGVHIIGSRAADIIDAASIAITKEMTTHEVYSIICAHPSFSEIWHEACFAASVSPIKKSN